jgi:nitrate reductase gamma subunit
MRVFVSLVAVVGLYLAALVGVGSLGLRGLFGVVLPYAAATVFLVGVVRKVLGWARSPVPFPIATTCGQQKSLPWIRQAKVENPSTRAGVVVRMALEVLCFRSLFRNTRTELHGDRITYSSSKWLWAAALAFHYSFLVILLRHLRLFTEPVPLFVLGIQRLDGFLLTAVPEVYATTVLFLAALGFLFVRRLWSAQLRYISLPADYFALFLLLGIGLSGAWLRHVSKIDVPAAKAMVMGLLHLSPEPSAALGAVFYGHLFLVSTLLAVLPFTKMMHFAGVFLSPTRNLRANTREFMHVNPWRKELPVHTYEEYEDEFRERMVEAGLPVDRTGPAKAASTH